MSSDVRMVRLSWLALVILAALPYLSGLRHAFVYDDQGQIVENTFLDRADSWRRVITLDTLNDGAVINGRRPLVLATYLADRAVWGMNPAGWRMSNLLMHVACVLALYALVRRLAPRPNNLFAFSAALLFAWHPVLIEAVHVPSFRPDLLYTLFALLMLQAALSRRVILSLVCFGLALLSKEAGVVAPVLLAACWTLFPETRPGRARVAWTLGVCAALFVAYAALCLRGDAHASVQSMGTEWNGRSWMFPENLWTLPWWWVVYVRLLVLPYPLIVDRVMDPVASPWTVPFILGLAVLAVTVWLAVGMRRRAPWVGFALCLMLAGFLPVSNLIPLLNPVAERYLYFSAVGYAIMLGRLIAGRRYGAGEWRRGALGAILVVYLVLVLYRIPDFRDDRTLWTRTLRDEPKSSRAHTWVGLDLKRQGSWREALDHFDKALALNPRDVSPIVNSAIVLGELGDLDAAERNLRAAIALRPSHAGAHWNLAIALQKQGRQAEALDALAEIIRLDPLHTQARKARIALWMELGRLGDALNEAEELVGVTRDPEALMVRDQLRDLRVGTEK